MLVRVKRTVWSVNTSRGNAMPGPRLIPLWKALEEQRALMVGAATGGYRPDLSFGSAFGALSSAAAPTTAPTGGADSEMKDLLRQVLNELKAGRGDSKRLAEAIGDQPVELTAKLDADGQSGLGFSWRSQSVTAAVLNPVRIAPAAKTTPTRRKRPSP